ncbi:MAG: ribbon-helix-helix domain-containing protein [Candidatus Nanoarchaeia archaeon]|nr:ribbon-helix-helix domain-containing protein [Candidatus Nanoarchaeia archaeon]
MNRMINLRLNQELIEEMDNAVKHSIYSSRTEFVKEAVRTAVKKQQQLKALKLLEEYYGNGKKQKNSQKEIEKIKEKVWNELKEELLSR